MLSGRQDPTRRCAAAPVRPSAHRCAHQRGDADRHRHRHHADATADSLYFDPNLQESGRFGLLDYQVPSGAVASSTIVAAQSRPLLGRNLPGAVTPTGSTLARRFHLTPSGADVLALVDFAGLTPRHRADLLASCCGWHRPRSFPKTRGFSDGGRVGLGLNILIADSAAAVLLLATAVGALLASQRRLRSLLGTIGIAREQPDDSRRPLVRGPRRGTVRGAGRDRRDGVVPQQAHRAFYPPRLRPRVRSTFGIAVAVAAYGRIPTSEADGHSSSSSSRQAVNIGSLSSNTGAIQWKPGG